MNKTNVSKKAYGMFNGAQETYAKITAIPQMKPVSLRG